jgi:hypothetical protein
MDDKMRLEEYKVEIIADKKRADNLFSILSNHEMDNLDLPPIPLGVIKDFISGKRSNLWEVAINGETYLDIVADKKSAGALVEMVEGAGREDFPLAPLPATNLRAFVSGQRDNVATIEIRKNLDVKPRPKE